MNNINNEVDNIKLQLHKKMINSIVMYCNRKKCLVDKIELDKLINDLETPIDNDFSTIFSSKSVTLQTTNVASKPTIPAGQSGQSEQSAHTRQSTNLLVYESLATPKLGETEANNSPITKNTSDKKNENYSVNPFFEVITIAAFQKDWKNLKEIHKIIKIREYAAQLKVSLHDQKKIMNSLIKLTKEKQLDNKVVNYNYETCKIEHIDDKIIQMITSTPKN